MKLSKLLLIAVFMLISSFYQLVAQNVDCCKWLDHLPYNNCISVAEAGNLIFAATPYSVFYFNKSDNSLTRLNKVTTNGLSDIGISMIAFGEKNSKLVVAYANTNIDLVYVDPVNGLKVINIPDIKRKPILGNKTINQVLIIDKYAYLACGFGIVVLDLEKEEIKDTYYIGPSGSQIDVKDITFHQDDNRFYAATEKGIYSALATTNLAFYVNWVQDTVISGSNDNFNLIASFSGKIYANKTNYTWDKDTMFVKNGSNWTYFIADNHSNRTSLKVCGDRLLICNYLDMQVFKPDGTRENIYYSYNPGTIRPNDAMIDKESKVWIADSDQGLWSIDANNSGSNYIFNGPVSPIVAAMDISNRQLWVVPGGRTASFTNLFRVPQFFTFEGQAWHSYNSTTSPEISNSRDWLCVAADPQDENHAFLGSWGWGVIELDNGEIKQFYTPGNSSLQYIDGYGEGYLRIGGLAFDSENNLWVTNSGAANILSVRKVNGEWKSYNLGSLGTAVDVGNLLIDKDNQKWMQMRDLALFVYNDNGTPDDPSDDQKRKLTNAAGNGALPGSSIASMAVDRDGQLWLGTDQGVAVIYSPSNVFGGGSFDAQQIMVEEEGYLHPLLETEAITAIAVNGNNEKWIGTDKAGVFLMSSDGTQELQHFTEANSPLLSNSIQSIKISSSGEVYFGTSLGIVSYKDYKVEPQQTLDSLTVYPNPVRPGNTCIHISNLVAGSNVKITGVSGGLVWETQAEGGDVIWDGNNLEGRRVNTGVYYIFVTNEDGSQKKSGKVLVVR